jgi:hypothetical protein
MDLVLFGNLLDGLQAVEGFETHLGFKLGTMAAALGFHRVYFGWFSHPPHANFDSLSSSPVFGVHHTDHWSAAS